MNKLLIIGLTIIMFFFKSTSIADYEKTFFDFKIESINGETINLKEYQDKAVLQFYLH